MRKFICIIALLCSIFVSEAQLIIPIGKTYTSQDVLVQMLNKETDKFEDYATVPLVQDFTFIAKDSLTVKVDGLVIVTIKIKGEVLVKKLEKVEIYYYTITRTFEGETVTQLMGIFTDRYGKINGLAVGDDFKISTFMFKTLQTSNN